MCEHRPNLGRPISVAGALVSASTSSNGAVQVATHLTREVTTAVWLPRGPWLRKSLLSLLFICSAACWLDGGDGSQEGVEPGPLHQSVCHMRSQPNTVESHGRCSKYSLSK